MLDCIRGLCPWRRVRRVPVMELPATIPVFFCPQEIIRLILGHLPPESVAAFALTCRRFYPHLPSAPLNEEARLLLLVWIEKDISHLYLCYKCKDLHTWRQSIWDTSYERYCRKAEGVDPGRVLRFTDGRLIMNRHIYGKSHGPPVEAFNHTKSTTDYRGLKKKRCRSARIIGDELYFKMTTQLSHNQGRARIFRELIDYSCFIDKLICQHVGLTKRSHDRTYRTHDLDKPLGSTELFVPVTGPLRSCRHCFTDFCIDVEWHPLTSKTTKGWTITITQWHQLGKFRSPQDTKWYNYKTDKYRERHGPWREDISVAGIVYDNWSAQDDESAEHMAEDGIVQRKNAGFLNTTS